MIEFGKTLRAAREAKGLGIDDIAKATHMMSRQIEALENEDFSQFAAPIYGRGFVKLYCEVIGLDAECMSAAFMDAYNGYQEPVVQLPEEVPTAADGTEPENAEEPSAPLPQTDEKPVPPVIVQPTFDDPIQPPPPAAQPPLREHAPSRYAAPAPIDEKPSKLGIPLLWIWRPIFLLACVVVVVWLIVCGVRALFRSPAPVEAESTTETAATQPVQREKITVQPLYIDQDQ